MASLRDRIGRWLTPFARNCPLSPNSITIIAFLLNVGAAIALACSREWPATILAAIPLFGLGAILDGFDGVVARVKGLSSKRGDFLDHMLDRVSDGLMLTGWMIGTSVRPEIALPALLLVTLNGYAGTQLEASFGSRDYSDIGRGEFITAIIAMPTITALLRYYGYGDVRILSLTVAEVFVMLILLFAVFGIVQRMRRGLAQEE